MATSNETGSGLRWMVPGSGLTLGSPRGTCWSSNPPICKVSGPGVFSTSREDALYRRAEEDSAEKLLICCATRSVFTRVLTGWLAARSAAGGHGAATGAPRGGYRSSTARLLPACRRSSPLELVFSALAAPPGASHGNPPPPIG